MHNAAIPAFLVFMFQIDQGKSIYSRGPLEIAVASYTSGEGWQRLLATLMVMRNASYAEEKIAFEMAKVQRASVLR
jgi:hypothetical protein